MISEIRQKIIDAARSCLGTPFHHLGKLPGVGLDCIGLLEISGKPAGFKAKEYETYKRIPDGRSLMRELRRQLCEIDPESAIPGDILVFYINEETKKPQHVGFLTDKGLIHTWTAPGKVVEHDFTDDWKRRVVAAFSFLGII